MGLLESKEMQNEHEKVLDAQKPQGVATKQVDLVLQEEEEYMQMIQALQSYKFPRTLPPSPRREYRASDFEEMFGSS